MSKNDQIQIDVARAQLLSSEADIAMYRGCKSDALRKHTHSCGHPPTQTMLSKADDF